MSALRNYASQTYLAVPGGSRVIRSFADRETAKIYDGETSSKLPRAIQTRAMRKLWMLDAATQVDDLRRPPGNRLEKLYGRRAGQHSIRINDQWRICFVWDDGPADVEITDYHD
jgi:proteic killer suppression protein